MPYVLQYQENIVGSSLSKLISNLDPQGCQYRNINSVKIWHVITHMHAHPFKLCFWKVNHVQVKIYVVLQEHDAWMCQG